MHNVPKATIRNEKDVKRIYKQIIARDLRHSAEYVSKTKEASLIESLV